MPDHSAVVSPAMLYKFARASVRMIRRNIYGLAYGMFATLAYCRVTPDVLVLGIGCGSLTHFAGHVSDGTFQQAYSGVAPHWLAYCRVAPDVTRTLLCGFAWPFDSLRMARVW